MPMAQLVAALHQRLMRIDEHLGVEVAKTQHGIEVLFTAYAVPERIPLVRKLVEGAPEMLGWKLVALRPPAKDPFTHSRGGVDIASKDVFFYPLIAKSRPGSVGIRLYVPAAVLTMEGRDDLLWCLVSKAAGEQSASHIEFLDAAATPAKLDEQLPLAELGEFISWTLRRAAQP